MKTKAILDKYKKLISGLIDVKSETIKFFVSGRGSSEEDKAIKDEIDALTYTKSNSWDLGYYEVFTGESKIASFRLYQLQHCCAFMVSCNANVESRYRNKRVGTTLNSLRQDIGRLLGYSAILCTDIDTNVHQRQLLATQGWKDIHKVSNKRTNNLVFLSVINI